MRSSDSRFSRAKIADSTHTGDPRRDAFGPRIIRDGLLGFFDLDESGRLDPREDAATQIEAAERDRAVRGYCRRTSRTGVVHGEFEESNSVRWGGLESPDRTVLSSIDVPSAPRANADRRRATPAALLTGESL